MIEIEFDNAVLVQCPEKGFDFRMVKYCLSCTHYRGLSKATVNNEEIENSNPDSFQVICARPITRKLMKIASD